MPKPNLGKVALGIIYGSLGFLILLLCVVFLVAFFTPPEPRSAPTRDLRPDPVTAHRADTPRPESPDRPTEPPPDEGPPQRETPRRETATAGAAGAQATIKTTKSYSGEEIRLREYPRSQSGIHAGRITRDPEAIANFNPVGVWTVRQGETRNSPTAGYMYVFEDGSLTLLGPNCGHQGLGKWRYEAAYSNFVLTNADGSEDTATVVGVPWRSRIEADGSESYIEGLPVWFATGRYWEFLGRDTTTEC